MVGLDGTASSVSALTWATREALIRRTHLHVVSCQGTPAGDPSGAARRLLDELAPCLPVAYECLPHAATAWRALVAAAHNAALVVVGGDADGAFADVLPVLARRIEKTVTGPLAFVRRGQDTVVGTRDRVVVCVGDGWGARNTVSWAAREVLYRDLIYMSRCTLHVLSATPSRWEAPSEALRRYVASNLSTGPLAGVAVSFDPPPIEPDRRSAPGNGGLIELARASDLLVLDADGYRVLASAPRPAGEHPDLHLAPCPVVITPAPRGTSREPIWAATVPG